MTERPITAELAARGYTHRRLPTSVTTGKHEVRDAAGVVVGEFTAGEAFDRLCKEPAE